MLLYDRLMEHATREERAGRLGAHNQKRLDYLRAAGQAVYELTDVVPLFTDWENEKAKRVPRRPPAVPMWCEWAIQYSDKDGLLWDWTVGVVVCVAPTKQEIVGGWAKEPAHRAVVEAAEHLYVTQMFRCLNTPLRNVPDHMLNHPMLGVALDITRNKKVIADLNYMVWALSGESTKIDALAMCYRTAEVGRVGEIGRDSPWNILNCPGAAGLSSTLADPSFCAWPAFMAFSLLHCRNIEPVVNRPDASIQRKCEKQGSPPRSEWRTLSIQLPRLRRPGRVASAGGDGGTAQRFHLRSGSIRNLVHPRYHGHDNPAGNWHFWPHYWAGDPALGTIRTRKKATT